MTLPEYVTVTTAKYLRLLESDLELKALRAAGVDNWEGYSEVDYGAVEDDLDDAGARLEATNMGVTELRGWGPDYTDITASCHDIGCFWEHVWTESATLDEMITVIQRHGDEAHRGR
jgi:hypothetical protein